MSLRTADQMTNPMRMKMKTRAPRSTTMKRNMAMRLKAMRMRRKTVMVTNQRTGLGGRNGGEGVLRRRKRSAGES